MATFTSYKTKDGKRKYKFKVYLGKDPLTGKRIETSRQGFNSKKEAQIALRNVQADFEKNGWKKQNNKLETFDDLFYFWLESFKNTVKSNTAYTKKRRYETSLKSKVGNIKFKKIKVDFCQKLINDLAEKYAGYSLIYSCLSQPMDYAVKNGLIDSNPFRLVTYPRHHGNAHPHRKGYENFYNRDELKEFLSALRDYSQQRAFYLFPLCRLLAFSGMRVGEALALEWNDINFITGELTINKTTSFNRELHKVIVQSPKTKNSIRKIYLDEKTLSILKEWKLKQQKLFFIYGVRFDKKEYVFTKLRSNRLMYSSNVETSLQEFYKAHKELKPIAPHGFRHTHASLLFEAGATIKEVQERLGHKDAKTTLNIYTHVTNGKNEELPEKLVNYLDF